VALHPAALGLIRENALSLDKASRETPQQIKDQYRSASFVGQNRVVFNIHGNKYRLVVAVAYKFGAVYIKFVGTHKDYDKIDVESVDQ
jgi:mRNA interferase HigB